jgi:hypothetical protein
MKLDYAMHLRLTSGVGFFHKLGNGQRDYKDRSVNTPTYTCDHLTVSFWSAIEIPVRLAVKLTG